MHNVGEVVCATSRLWDVGYRDLGNTDFIIGSWMGLPPAGKQGGHLLVPLQCV